mmetsp:Transcript_71731/g.222462  ORF Transcript_71731/g.222462 Transcript_71731/m.222462 type:complete len:273 (-) Transcript_71731:558-1376(-)
MCQGFHEAVLTAVREEEVHAELEQVHLRQVRHAHGVGRRGQVPERVLLRAQGDEDERALLRGLRTEGVEGAPPGRTAELAARDPVRLPVKARHSALPAGVRGVPGDDGAHAHEHDAPPRRPRSPEESERVGRAAPSSKVRGSGTVRGSLGLVPVHAGAAGALAIEQRANAGGNHALLPVRSRQLLGHVVLQFFRRGHQRRRSEGEGAHLAQRCEPSEAQRPEVQAVLRVEPCHSCEMRPVREQIPLHLARDQAFLLKQLLDELLTAAQAGSG